ncbi:MAG: hypothetical protein K5778_02670 [Bacteroidaceae bacterium]|nr:hypothetical protein [Bacteroidaceae bacterium]
MIQTLTALTILLATLTQQMIDRSEGSFTVSQTYTLGGQALTLPTGYQLVFKKGGHLSNGTLRAIEGRISASSKRSIFAADIVIEGSWNVPNIYDKWFDYTQPDTNHPVPANQIIRNLLALANDDHSNHIFFSRNRSYYFELPYKGKANFGERVAHKVIKGVTRRNYLELYGDDYDFLRIFTIPSRTHITLHSNLQMLPTNVGAYFVFMQKDKHDIIIEGGGSIRGDAPAHLYDNPLLPPSYYGEWGHIFCFMRCRDITLRDITIADAFGDCVSYHGTYGINDHSPRWGERLTMQRVRIINARRNGITLAARNCRISECHFDQCGMNNGTYPMSAIDFEADGLDTWPELGNQNVIMENCTFGRNKRDIAASNNNLPSYGKIATTIRGCYFPNPIRITWGNWLRFERCTITSFIGAWNRPVDTNNSVKHNEFIDCRIIDFPEILKTSSWDNTFINCTIGK